MAAGAVGQQILQGFPHAPDHQPAVARGGRPLDAEEFELGDRSQKHVALRAFQLRLQGEIPRRGQHPLRRLVEIRRRPQMGRLPVVLGRVAHLAGGVHAQRAVDRRTETARLVGPARKREDMELLRRHRHSFDRFVQLHLGEPAGSPEPPPPTSPTRASHGRPPRSTTSVWTCGCSAR